MNPPAQPTPIRTLFLLKRREDYSTGLANFEIPEVASGMFNSATLVSQQVYLFAQASKVKIVIDNNCIDRAVAEFRPTHVFIEGYWVVPEKFDVLKNLHPTVTWIVRCHSELPFLAQEGVAIDWTHGYLNRGITVAANSPRMQADFRSLLSDNRYRPRARTAELTPLLPNIYPTRSFPGNLKAQPPLTKHHGAIHVSCFGALRPMKNHLVQAAAAIEYADRHGKALYFHVNTGRVEMYGQALFKNLRKMFSRLPNHTLIEHKWAGHKEFVEINRKMDIALQVSFTESFNIVTADAVSVGVPVLTSSEVPFVYPVYADPTSVKDIADKMEFVLRHKSALYTATVKRMVAYNQASTQLWMGFLHGKTSLLSDKPPAVLLAPPVSERHLYETFLRVKSLFLNW